MNIHEFKRRFDFRYFVEWRSGIWGPAVTHALSTTSDFAGKKVLDLGCRGGRMSCLFALMGANVVGLDLLTTSFERAEKEITKWNVQDNVQLFHYDGYPENIPGGDFDIVFTKSVLVVVPQLRMFLHGLRTKMAPGGHLLATENTKGNRLMQLIRTHIVHRKWPGFAESFHGVDQGFLNDIESVFGESDVKRINFLVFSIIAQKESLVSPDAEHIRSDRS